MKKRSPRSCVITVLTVLAASCAAVIVLLVALVLWRTVDWQADKADSPQTGTALSSAAASASDSTYEAAVPPSSDAPAVSPATEAVPPLNTDAFAADLQSAPADSSSPDVPSAASAPAAQDPYVELLGRYAKAITEQWDPGRLMQAGLNYMPADYHHGNPVQDIGYAKLDLDGDGRAELVIGPRVEDEFFGKIIFALYSLDESSTPRLIFESTERNRYYYAGGSHFANLGASSFDSSYVTTLKLQEGEMIDMTYTTQPSDYVQLALNPFA